MAGQPLLNGLPLEEAKRLEARGGSGMRGDPFARLRQPISQSSLRASVRVGATQSRAFAVKPTGRQDLTHSGTRLQTKAPLDVFIKPSAAVIGSGLRTEGKRAIPPQKIWSRKIEVPSGVLQPGMGLVLRYRDFVRGILGKFSLGFDHLSLIMLVLTLGLTVWLPLKIISSIFIGVLTGLLPTAAPSIGATIGMLTSTISFVASGYFIIDRLKSGKQE
jgi:hypothetical protein